MIRVAVISAWHVHAKEYAETVRKNPNSEIACVWDDDVERGKAFAQMFDVAFEPDLQKIWDDKTIDAVQITTATYQHKDVLIAAAKAGKHIFTEKVLAFTNEDAQAIREAVNAAGIKFTISYPHKSFSPLLAARELVDSGKLGNITYARVHNYHNGSTADWLPPHFYDAAQTGGGAMMDLGAHPMYTLSWFMGKPKSVISMFTQVTNRGVEDNAVSVLEFADGAIGVSETGFVTSGIGYVLELCGTSGSLLVHNNTLEYACGETENKVKVMESLPEAAPSPLNAWIDCVNAGTTPPCGIDDAIELTRFMVGAYESYRTGAKYIF